MFNKSIFLIFFVLIVTGYSFSQDNVDESSLFGDTSSVVSNNQIINNTVTSNIDKESVAFTGSIMSTGLYSMTRDWVNGITNTDLNQLQTYMQGNLFLDVRLTKGFKAFANIEAFYTSQGQLTPHYFSGLSLQTNIITNYGPAITNVSLSTNNITYYETNNTILSLKEFFVDGNINHAAYIRAGKQVVQWGVNYFWNPTDLINIQKKTFTDLNNYRDGSYGMKILVPFGTVINLYSFIDFTDIHDLEDTAIAGKFEFLIANTEFSLSAWAKRNNLPVYGFDFSTRLFTIDISGEASLSYGDNGKLLDLNNPVVIKNYGQTTTNYNLTQITNTLVPKFSLGLSRSFDFMNISDRITTRLEFFYNGAGYDSNILNDPYKRYSLLQQYNLYQPNYLSKYYISLFTTYNEFIIPDMTFAFNGIMNLVDYSSTLYGTISYNPLYDFTISLNIFGYTGATNCEYTLQGNTLAASIVATMTF